MNTDAKILDKILTNNKSNPTIYKKNYIPQPSKIYYRYKRLLQHLQINYCGPSCQKVKEEKSYAHINKCSKIIWQSPKSSHDFKNCQQTRCDGQFYVSSWLGYGTQLVVQTSV